MYEHTLKEKPVHFHPMNCISGFYKSRKTNLYLRYMTVKSQNALELWWLRQAFVKRKVTV